MRLAPQEPREIGHATAQEMTQRRGRYVRVALSVLLAASFFALAASQSHELMLRLDGAAVALDWHTPSMDLVMHVATRIAGEEALAVLTAVLMAVLFYNNRRTEGVLLGAALVVGNLSSAVLKWVYDRPRPPIDFDPPSLGLGWIDELWIGLAMVAAVALWLTRWRRVGLLIAGLTALILTVDLAGEMIFADRLDSFPSGHAVRASAVVVGLVLVSWKTRWRLSASLLGLGFIFLVALSRVYLGVHYPSDVLAGSAIAASAVLALSLVPRLDPFMLRKTTSGEEPPNQRQFRAT